MKKQNVLLSTLIITVSLLFVAPGSICDAQRSAGKRYEKSVFGKSRKGKDFDDRVKTRGAAGKAIKEQARKEEARKKAGDRTMNERRDRHVRIQSPATQERMLTNRKSTEEKYKAKRQRQKQEQTKPKKKNYRKP